MGKKRRKKKYKNINDAYPTIFVHQGSVQLYPDGPMLELHTKLTNEEWTEIVKETISYHTFVECLKSTAFPMLNEQWDTHDEWYRLQIEMAISRMRNIDPLLVASINTEEMKNAFTQKMTVNAKEFMKYVHELKQSAIDNKSITVSDI